jgi:hypothetical protein
MTIDTIRKFYSIELGESLPILKELKAIIVDDEFETVEELVLNKRKV